MALKVNFEKTRLGIPVPECYAFVDQMAYDHNRKVVKISVAFFVSQAARENSLLDKRLAHNKAVEDKKIELAQLETSVKNEIAALPEEFEHNLSRFEALDTTVKWYEEHPNAERPEEITDDFLAASKEEVAQAKVILEGLNEARSKFQTANQELKALYDSGNDIVGDVAFDWTTFEFQVSEMPDNLQEFAYGALKNSVISGKADGVEVYCDLSTAEDV